jgi:plastocyanin
MQVRWPTGNAAFGHRPPLDEGQVMGNGIWSRTTATRPSLAILCAVLVLSAALAACGSSSSNAQEGDGASSTIAAQHASLSTSAASIVVPTMDMTHEHATATSTAPVANTPAATAAAATSTATTPAEPSAVTPTETVEVHIIDFGFDPPMVGIAAGTTVTFINDGVDHTATSKPGAPVAFDSGILHTGQSFSFTFDTPGNYDFWCLLHPDMVGMIMVQ